MYKLQKFGVCRLLDGALIPQSDGNRDWREYQQWLAAGNIPEPEDQPTPAELIKQEIATLEAANPITPRALRELALVVDQIVTQLSGAPINSAGMQKVREVEAKIAVLRGKL